MGKTQTKRDLKMTKTVKSGRILKYGRVVLLLTGRYAGRKGVIVKVYDDANGDRKFPHALVAGINRYPKKVHKNLSKKKFENKIKIKPFMKYVNLNHLMPTRHILSSELDLEEFNKNFEKEVRIHKDAVKQGTKSDYDPMNNPEKKSSFLKDLKKKFESKYRNLDLNSSDEK